MDEFIENLQVGSSMQEFFKGQVQSCLDDLLGGTSTFAEPFNGYLTFFERCSIFDDVLMRQSSQIFMDLMMYSL